VGVPLGFEDDLVLPGWLLVLLERVGAGGRLVWVVDLVQVLVSLERVSVWLGLEDDDLVVPGWLFVLLEGVGIGGGLL